MGVGEIGLFGHEGGDKQTSLDLCRSVGESDVIVSGHGDVGVTSRKREK